MNKGIKTKYGKPLLKWKDLECYVKDLEKEIERLNENNQAMQEEMARTWEKLDKKENIIKEVREYIESYMPNYDFDKTNLIKLLEILDKEKNSE